MKRLFLPDFYFDSVFDISPDFLAEQNVLAVLLDIDNTLVTYADPEPTERVKEWTGSLRESGFFVAVVSNNEKERVERFCKPLSLCYTYKSAKPSRRGVKDCCQQFGVRPKDCVMIGDQIFTDILCGNRSGTKTILVRPLPYDENLFFRIKRKLEKPFIRAYRRREKRRTKEGKA